MTSPTFLGIGTPRAGTTWLHRQLAAHPDVYVPTRRKEVRFFDLHYARGMGWYARFFPSETEGARYQAIGEISPYYVYSVRCAERIAAVPSIVGLILMLRNPVDRLYSHYWFNVRSSNYAGTFEEYVSARPDVVRLGFCSQQLRDYLCLFHRGQILVLVFEHVFADTASALDTVARFLGVDERHFSQVGGDKVNRAYVPRFGGAYALAMRARRYLLRRDLDWVINLARRLGVEKAFGESRPIPPMRKDTRRHLCGVYRQEVCDLEDLLQVDLGRWRAMDAEASPCS